MSGKFMKVKRVLIPVMTLVVIASQLTGCAGTTQQEAIDMANKNDSIEIEVAVPDEEADTKIAEVVWVELGKLETYPEFRAKIDEIFGIKKDNLGKSGCMYVNGQGEVTDNSTLRFAFNRPAFSRILFENTPSIEKWVAATNELYPDVESEKDAMLAMLDAYFCLFNDGTQTEFNGNQTLTRAEYLTGVFKASNPVRILDVNIELNYDSFSPFVNQMLKYNYLTLEDGSMNEKTYNGAMTRAEAIYTIVRMYYNDELDRINNDFKGDFDDAKNGGYNTDATINSETELSNALKNPDGGMPADLYKALVVAQAHDIIGDGDTRWDASITKAEAIELILRAYVDREAWTDSAEDDPETIVVPEEVKETKQIIFRATNGEVAYTKDVIDTVMEKLTRSGLDVGYANQVIEDYFSIMEGKDISSLDMTILDNLISSLDKKLDAEKQAQQAQREENKQNQQAQQNQNNNSGNKNNNSGGGNKDNSSNAPSDWVTPEKEDTSNDGPGPGEFSIDLGANDGAAGNGGEYVTDIELND